MRFSPATEVDGPFAAPLAVSAAYILYMSPPRLALLKFRLDNRLALWDSASPRALGAFPPARRAGRGGSHPMPRVSSVGQCPLLLQ